MRNRQKNCENTPPTYVCDIDECGKVFTTGKKLYDHKYNRHLISKVYVCPECDRPLSTPSKLKKHSLVHKKRPCPVEGCSVELGSYKEERRHVAECHQKTSCDQCSKSFSCRPHLKRHQRLVHKKLIPCPFEDCDKRILPHRMGKHLSEMHADRVPKDGRKASPGPGPYSCPHCSANFEKPDNLKRHVTRSHSAKPKSETTAEERPKAYLCPMTNCGRRFVNWVKLESHVNAHKNVKPYICPQENCSRGFCGKMALQKHLRLFHFDNLYEYSVDQIVRAPV